MLQIWRTLAEVLVNTRSIIQHLSAIELGQARIEANQAKMDAKLDKIYETLIPPQATTIEMVAGPVREQNAKSKGEN